MKAPTNINRVRLYRSNGDRGGGGGGGRSGG